MDAQRDGQGVGRGIDIEIDGGQTDARVGRTKLARNYRGGRACDERPASIR